MNKKERIESARKAGSVTSRRKAAAARKNGKRGGRPVENPAIRALMKKHNCSRQWAYQLLKAKERQ
jgi:hypothetical protein